MEHYIHNINPIVLDLVGPLAIRWYGLSYLLSFVCAYLLLRRWSKSDSFQVPVDQVGDFMVMLALFGVFIGGRVGHILLYSFDTFIDDPLYLFRVWEGGMASHGGVLGVVLFMIWYARKHGYAFWNLADHMACTAALGFGFGRLANFINGELWGRITSVRWAVIFPQEAGWEYGSYNGSIIRQQIESGELMPRHPSQLYQAAAEGFLVFGIMLLLRRTAWGKRPSALSASFLMLYALARIAMECYREPDSTVYFGWLTKGQLYSGLMILAALLIALKTQLFKRSNVPTS